MLVIFDVMTLGFTNVVWGIFL